MTANFTDFYEASQARDIARGGGSALGVILTEINAIKILIDTNAPTGALSTTIINSTTMTSSSVYYNAWNDPVFYTDDASVLARSRMDAVIRYFTSLGYRVQRQREATQNRFEWIFSW
jgi:hypothetical protein